MPLLLNLLMLAMLLVSAATAPACAQSSTGISVLGVSSGLSIRSNEPRPGHRKIAVKHKQKQQGAKQARELDEAKPEQAKAQD
jgi:hypothetical protein